MRQWETIVEHPFSLPSFSGTLLASLLLVSCLPAMSAVGQDTEDFRPGLLAEFRAGDRSVQRIDKRLAFRWESGSPDVRMGADFSARWKGQLLVRSPGLHRFYVQLSGKLVIRAGGMLVFSGLGQDVFLSGDPIALSGGDLEFEVDYESGDAGNSGFTPAFQVYWSGEDFTLEPLPADCLSHSAGDAAAEFSGAAGAKGRFVTDALRCAACHTGVSDMPVLSAPDLRSSVGWLSDSDLRERLMGGRLNHAMPVYSLNEHQVADIISYLRSESPVVVASPMEGQGSVEDADAGDRLLLTLGCAACHTVHPSLPASQSAAEYGGPSLCNPGIRRRAAWLDQWLSNPEKINPAHRMPVFELSAEERRQLVAALRRMAVAGGENAGDSSSVVTGDRERGKLIVQELRCVSCHQMSQLQVPPRLAVGAPGKGVAGGRSCLVGPGDVRLPGTAMQPTFRNSDEIVAQAHAWLHSLRGAPVSTDRFHRGEVVLQRHGCVSCHDRDTGLGMSRHAATIESLRDDLKGHSQQLIPPSLTAVGDRLRDEVLAEAVSGSPSIRRLPWLTVRMPRFSLSEEDREAISFRLITEDRIPDSADSVRAELFEHMNPHHPSLASPEELVAGNLLAGASGFNCIACHKAGAFEPRNVAFGTRGSDLLLMGKRLRSRYFMRWMRNPIRVLSGIEMPAIRKPVDRQPEQSLAMQMAVLWKSLSDPGFVPPTVASRYEQVMAVKRGRGPHVIRDVFLSEGGRSEDAISRAFAVGFGNGHSVLIDLDHGRLVRWTAGEYARQRTEGKSWFWSLSGVPVGEWNADEPEVQLVYADGRDAGLKLVADEGRVAELLSWTTAVDSVELRLRWHFGDPLDAGSAGAASPHSQTTSWQAHDENRTLIVKIRLQELATDTEGAGIRVEYTVERCPEGMAVRFPSWRDGPTAGRIPGEILTELQQYPDLRAISLSNGQVIVRRMQSLSVPGAIEAAEIAPIISDRALITAVPGFRGTRSSLPTGIMPTAMTWRKDGRLALTSLKGQVWLVDDRDGDGEYDAASVFAEGLAAPYGILADGNDLLVAHKPEIIRLRDLDGDSRAEHFDVVASGWGYSDDYHDWTAGLARDPEGNLYVGLGSDYSQKGRSENKDRWRGTVLKVAPGGLISPVAYSMRFPMGLAFDAEGRLYATDNQGVQNTFNEINHVIAGKHYGVPSRHEREPIDTPETPALMIPHPWTRSVNSITFLPKDFALGAFAGHGIGCEYDTQCLIRFTMQEVSGVMQGACYRFSRLPGAGESPQFMGPISSAVGPDGSLYIGSLRDSGWQGAGNTGCIERLTPDGDLPNGIREIRATSSGFDVEFLRPLPVGICEQPDDWEIQSYTRHWTGGYSTPDAERRRVLINRVTVNADRRTATLGTDPHVAGHLYEIRVGGTAATSGDYWPSEGFYTMKRVPQP